LECFTVPIIHHWQYYVKSTINAYICFCYYNSFNQIIKQNNKYLGGFTIKKIIISICLISTIISSFVFPASAVDVYYFDDYFFNVSVSDFDYVLPAVYAKTNYQHWIMYGTSQGLEENTAFPKSPFAYNVTIVGWSDQDVITAGSVGYTGFMPTMDSVPIRVGSATTGYQYMTRAQPITAYVHTSNSGQLVPFKSYGRYEGTLGGDVNKIPTQIKEYSSNSIVSGKTYVVVTKILCASEDIYDQNHNIYFKGNSTTGSVVQGKPASESFDGQFKIKIIQPYDSFKQSQMNKIKMTFAYTIPWDSKKDMTGILFDFHGDFFDDDFRETWFSEPVIKDGIATGTGWIFGSVEWDYADLMVTIQDHYGRRYNDIISVFCTEGFVDANNDGLDDKAGDTPFKNPDAVTGEGGTGLGTIGADGQVSGDFFTQGFSFMKMIFNIFPPEIMTLFWLSISALIILGTVRFALH